jgi:hypothetical protein
MPILLLTYNSLSSMKIGTYRIEPAYMDLQGQTAPPKKEHRLTLFTGVQFSNESVSLGSTIVRVIFDPMKVDNMTLVDSDLNEYTGADINRRILQELSDEMLERLYFNVHRHSSKGVCAPSATWLCKAPKLHCCHLSL